MKRANIDLALRSIVNPLSGEHGHDQDTYEATNAFVSEFKKIANTIRPFAEGVTVHPSCKSVTFKTGNIRTSDWTRLQNLLTQLDELNDETCR